MRKLPTSRAKSSLLVTPDAAEVKSTTTTARGQA
jgi:hypothetical protein